MRAQRRKNTKRKIETVLLYRLFAKRIKKRIKTDGSYPEI